MNLNNYQTPRRCWVVTNGRAGTEKPCLALAEALKLVPETKRVCLRFPWSLLPPRAWLFPLRAYSETGARFEAPWPNVIISSGRAAAAGVVALKHFLVRQGVPAPVLIHLMNPHYRLDAYDVVIAPTHDQLSGPNVIAVLGALHNLSPKKISTYRGNPVFPFYKNSAPKLAIFIGGESKHYRFNTAVRQQLVAELKELAQQGYALMISPSRRTPTHLITLLKDALPDQYIWSGIGDNPYLDMLKAADAYLVTADSVAMISEMASLEKNLYVYPLPAQKSHNRLQRFIEAIYQQGYASRYERGALSIKPEQPQLNEMERVVSAVAALLPGVFER